MIARPQNHISLNEDDADKRAIDNLTNQVKGQRGPIATLIRARRDQLKAEVKAERSFETGLLKTQKNLIRELFAGGENPEIVTALLSPNSDLTTFILQNGLGDALAEFIDATGEIRDSMLKGLTAVGIDQPASIQPELDFLQAQTANAIFEDVIAPDFKSAIRSSLVAMTQNIPLAIVKSNLQTRLERSTGRQLTEIKTQISEYGRSITATAAAAADLDLYLYTGPNDGITRPFCKRLINLVVDESQMNKLNNGQGKSVKTSCGGYNCRHSWSPITESFVEAADLKRATMSDINDANSDARKKR